MIFQSTSGRRGRAIASTLIALSLLSIPTAANSASDPTAGIPSSYKDYQEFPMCDSTVTTFCISSWGIDLTNSGTFSTPNTATGITFNAWIFSIAEFKTPGLAYELRVNGNQELFPEVPFGTAFQFAINTGTFKPSPSLFTQAEVQDFDMILENGNWISKGTFRTSSWPFALGCEADENCSNPKNQRDYQSFSQGVQFYEEPNLLLESKRGMWVSTNAAVTGEIQFDRESMTWSVDLSGPAKKADGTVNTLRYSTFIPDAFIQFAYGTTADVLANTLVTTRTDGSVTSAVPATITRVTSPQPGLLISMPSISLAGTSATSASVRSMASRYSTAPKIRIKPKSALLNAPRNARAKRLNASSAQISSSPIRGAKKYQAMCSKGATSVFAMSRKPSVRIKGLTRGPWKCSIRGVQKVGGKWSTNVKLK
jgi:hypothetical protein